MFAGENTSHFYPFHWLHIFFWFAQSCRKITARRGPQKWVILPLPDPDFGALGQLATLDSAVKGRAKLGGEGPGTIWL